MHQTFYENYFTRQIFCSISISESAKIIHNTTNVIKDTSSANETTMMTQQKISEENTDLDCGCIPKGVCEKGTETSDCKGSFELCCVSRQLIPKSSDFDRPSPVFRPTFKKLECVDRKRCKVAYGESSADISM